MIVFCLAYRNLWRHPRRTYFIAAMIVLGSMLLSIASSVLEEASKGMEVSLVGSLTGHLALGALTEESYGLFGSEVPIVGDYETIPPIEGGKEIFPLLQRIPGISSYTSIVSSFANISIGKFSQKSVVFGIDAASYFSVMKDIEILWGSPEELNHGGAFLNEVWVKKAESYLKRPLKSGEKIVAAVASHGSFRLRTFHVAGIYRYKAPSEILDRVLLADPMLVRSLVNYTLGNKIGNQKNELSNNIEHNSELNSIDDIFNSAQDIVNDGNTEITLQSVEADLQDTSQRDERVAADSAAWSFILIRKNDAISVGTVKSELSKRLEKNGIDVRILDWYTAAGSNAMMLFTLKSALNIGVLFLISGALMILINSLVISVLERTGEIGTLRALGAHKVFIIRMVLVEICILTMGAAIIGLLLSVFVMIGISHAGIRISNPLLIGLFGGSSLKPHLSIMFIVAFLIGTIITSLLSSIYPIRLALQISPREAIAQGET